MSLELLSNAFGPSGYEDEVRDYILETAQPLCDHCSIDTMGNLVCFKAGTKKNQHRILLSAHMDEVGFIIRGITDDGYLRFSAVGGIDPGILSGKLLAIGPKRQKGVIGAKPSHAKKGENEDLHQISDLYIDIGATSRTDAEQFVSIGDYACFTTSYGVFGKQIKGKALDDRIGCYILLELMKHTYPNDLYFAFTVQEEVGCRGARVVANAIQPQTAIVVEATTCADVPGTSIEEQCTRLGDGPAFTIKDRGTIMDRALTNALTKAATDKGIRWQYKQTISGGNDAFAIQTGGSGVKVASLSVPCRYIHGPVGVANKQDIDNAYAILHEWLTNGVK